VEKMIFQITVNPIMALLEAIIFTIVLFVAVYIIYKLTPADSRMDSRKFIRNTVLSCLITLGITVGIKVLFQILEYFHPIFSSLKKDQFLFVLMIAFFTLFIRKFGSNQREFLKKINLLLVLYSILSVLFLSIDLLDLMNVLLFVKPIDRSIIVILFKPANSEEIFYLGFFSAFIFILFNFILTYIINRMRNNEHRIIKPVLKKTMLTSGCLSFFIWAYQLFIFAVYLGNFFNLGVLELDIRIQMITLIGIYAISFFYFLKYKYLPASDEISKLKLENLKEQLTEESGFEELERELVLKVEDLKTYFYTEEGIVKAVEGISFEIYKGEVLGLVGETGCGKSVTALSLQKLIFPPGKIEEGRVIYYGEDLLTKTKEEILEYRGKEITMIFQDPLNSLNPVFRVGQQISEVYLTNMKDELLLEASKDPNKNSYAIARDWSVKMLKELNIPHPEVIFDLYPHELSGGMRQRIQIAMALACNPKLLIADEPTTALDVTIQNQILKLMKNLLKEYDTSILFITHNLGIISKMCDRIAIMYSGYIVEYGERIKFFKSPCHPYTKGLLKSIPKIGEKRKDLHVIPGSVPNLIYPPPGCRFHPRCPNRFEPCDSQVPRIIEVEPNYFVACHLYDPKHNLKKEVIK
jgi:peptide/nickel transport system ATP-binding protein